MNMKVRRKEGRRERVTMPYAYLLTFLPSCLCGLLITAHRKFHALERERLLVQFRGLVRAPVFPGGHIAEILIVPLGLAVGHLVLYAEVAAAGLVPVQGIAGHELAELEEVGNASCLLEFLVQLRPAPRHLHVLPELLADCRDAAEGLLEALLAPGHAHVL